MSFPLRGEMLQIDSCKHYSRWLTVRLPPNEAGNPCVLRFLGPGSAPWSGLCHRYEGNKFAHNMHVPFTFCSLVLKAESSLFETHIWPKKGFQKGSTRPELRRRPRKHGNVFVVLLRTQNWVRRKLKNGSVREAFCEQEAMWRLSVGGVGLGNAFLEALNEACLKSSFLDRFEEVLDVIVKAVLL